MYWLGSGNGRDGEQCRVIEQIARYCSACRVNYRRGRDEISPEFTRIFLFATALSPYPPCKFSTQDIAS